METNQAVFKNPPNGIVVISENGTISHLNPVAERIFACTSKKAEGKKFPELLQDIDIDEHELLAKCTSKTPYSTCKRATTLDGKDLFLDLWIAKDSNASEETRYLVFVNDITSQKKRESELKQAYAIETTLKKVLHICRTVEKLEDTLKHALQITIALPDVKAISRAVIMVTGNNLSRLELKAHIGLDPDEISSFFHEETGSSFSLDNTSEQTEALCTFIAQDKTSYHAIIEGGSQTVVMIIALEEKIQNAFAYENLNSIADVIANTIEREKLKNDQSELIVSLNESLSDLGAERSFSVSILESLKSGLLVIDNDNRITQANPAAKEFLLNLYDEDITGKTLKEIFGPDTNSLLNDNDSLDNNTVTIVNLNDEETDLEFTTAPIYTQDGNIKGRVVVFTDVTEQRKMEVKFDKLNRFGAIAEIAAAVAQEVKNPLTGIKSISQILDNRLSDDDENKEHITRIIRQVDRLDLLLNEFFSYARPLTPNKQETMLGDVLSQSWQMAEARGGKKGLSLHEDLRSGNISLWVDPEQLQQVFVHLFLNAIEAIDDNSYVEVISEFVEKPSEKHDLSLYNGLNDDFSYLVVVVRDSGCGVTKDVADKLFDPFVTNKSHHSGLGLSLVWRILKEHESNIYFDSTVGKGTTFTVFIKADQQAN